METVNSKAYWDERFASRDWEKFDGKGQSVFFAKVAFMAMPEFLKRDLSRNSWTVIDIGCAQGDGTAFLAKQFPECHFVGQDFSSEAIKLAASNYPNCEFEVADIYQDIRQADVIFSSNTLEHLKQPLGLMEKMCNSATKYAVHLLPFEDQEDIPEHINSFTFDAFPLRIGSFYLESYRVLDCREIKGTYWLGRQIMLVYTNQNYRPEKRTILDVHNNFGVGDYEQRVQDLKVEIEVVTKEKILKLENELLYTKNTAAEQIRLLENEKNQVSEQAKVLNEELQETKRRLQEQMCMMEEQKRRHTEEKEMLEKELQENKGLTAEQVSKLELELQESRQKIEELTAQLDAEKAKYDNLYVYSGARDLEMITFKNSRSYRFYMKWMIKPIAAVVKVCKKVGRVCKALATFNGEALKSELVAPVSRVYHRIKDASQKKKLLADLRQSLKGKTVVVMNPTIDWHMPLFQRPQQLAAAYSRMENIAVVYITKDVQYDHVGVAEQINPNLWIVNEHYVNELRGLMELAREVVLCITWTLNKHYVDLIKPDKLIYEYIDELEIFYGYGPEMEVDHLRFLQEADVTVCTATKLYDQAKDKAKNPILSPNAGDYDFFEKTKSYEINPLIKDVIKPYKCVLGYYGAVAEWFDYDLLKTVAERHPEWVFVLVGVNYDGSMDRSGILDYENIVYIPPQPYTELPSFLTGFDIATIPFVINEITLSTSPVKLFEYMASGKPILSSRMPECLKYESVKTYADADEFCQLVESLMALKSDDSYWITLKQDALDNTWDARTKQIIEAL